MKLIFSYFAPFKRRMALGLSIKISATLIELLIPFILSYILKNVVGSQSVTKILLFGLIMIVCAFLACVFNIIANRMAADVSSKFAEQIRRDLFKRTLYLSAAQTDKFTIPSLESRITTDTYHVLNFVNIMQRMGIRAPILIVGGVGIALIMDARLALVMIAIMPLIFVSVYFLSRRGVPLYTKVQSATDDMVRVVREDSQGIRVIKALSKNEFENERFDEKNLALVKAERRAGIIMGAVNPIMTFLMNGGIAAVTLLSAFLVTDGVSDPETVIAFMQYFTLISMAMMAVSRIFLNYTKCAASARRIAEVLKTPIDMEKIESEKVDTDDYIRFENVDFSYNGKHKHLSNIDFSLKKGESLGIIGATGSGKSTLIKLLFRFYDVTGGRITIDGRDVRSYGDAELSRLFGVALQNDFLYAASIEENIRFGRSLTFEEISEAARTAQAEDFILAFNDGYEHELSQKGTNISGGQKQRLLIARAIAEKPDIVVFDDSSSALDYKTDAALREALSGFLSNSTVITVTQRVSSIKHCNLILVLENGEIIDKGNHEYLMENSSVYREISNSQMGGAFVE